MEFCSSVIYLISIEESLKISNLYQVEAKISQLKLDDNVLSIELDTIDPTIENQ
jgi:hypothetical protein